MKLLKFIKNPKLIIRHFKLKRLYGKYGRSLIDEEYLKQMYKLRVGKDLNLENPKTFNEKLQWLKLYDRNPEYTKLVDKYEVKKYIADTIGEEYVVPTFGVYDSFDEIDFDSLPNQFVIKCTHDSGSLMICKDKSKFNVKKAQKYFTKKLAYNYYWNSREWPYKNVKPRIIIEKYIKSDSNSVPNDYKLLYFNGEYKCAFVVSERFSSSGIKVTFFDKEWNRLPFEREYPSANYNINKPKHYDKIVLLAKKLAKNHIFVRIDFFQVEDMLLVGELTFFPGSGFEPFQPDEWDGKLGEFIKLPIDNKN